MEPAVLENIGFDRQEAIVYLYLLQHGARGQQDIAEGTQILRQTVYDIVARMEHKAYVTVAQVGKRKFYTAIEPKLLLARLQEKEEAFENALPELQKLKLTTTDVASQSFIGMEGLKSLFALTLDAKSDILWLANKRVSEQIFRGYYWQNYAKKRIEKKLPIKLLIEEKTTDDDWKTDKKSWRETKQHPVIASMDSSFLVFDDTVIIYANKGELLGVHITSRTIADSFRKMFGAFWDAAGA